jgi:hypothetical protein
MEYILGIVVLVAASIAATASPLTAPLPQTLTCPYGPELLSAALVWEVPYLVLAALVWVESGCSAGARNPVSGALGVAQLTRGGRAAVSRLRRARGAAPCGPVCALSPAMAIMAAAELLSFHLAECGTLVRALGAYGSGRCGGARAYSRRVLREAQRLRGWREPVS